MVKHTNSTILLFGIPLSASGVGSKWVPAIQYERFEHPNVRDKPYQGQNPGAQHPRDR